MTNHPKRNRELPWGTIPADMLETAVSALPADVARARRARNARELERLGHPAHWAYTVRSEDAIQRLEWLENLRAAAAGRSYAATAGVYVLSFSAEGVEITRDPPAATQRQMQRVPISELRAASGYGDEAGCMYYYLWLLCAGWPYGAEPRVRDHAVLA